MKTYPLNEAACSADIVAVQALIKGSALLNELDEFGHTPLHWAVIGGYEDIVEALLVAGANPNVFSNDEVTPKWRARDFGLIEIENLFAKYGGRIDTDEKFNRIAFQIFNEEIGQPLPKEERQGRLSAFVHEISRCAKLVLNSRK